MRSLPFLFVLSIMLLSCAETPSSKPVSSVNGESQVVLESVDDTHEVIQEFDLDNCDGKAEAARIEHRSSSIDVTISIELTARIGASAQVISADVQAAVGTALNVGGERGTSIEVKAPPNTHMFFELAWVGKSRIGVVQNASGSNIPVAFQSFSPENVHIKSQYDIGCPTSPLPTTSLEPMTPQNADESLLTIDDKTNNILSTYTLSAGISSPASCPGIYLETGASEIIYEIVAPASWVIVIDSWKADWATGSYQNDGILVITGEWQGDVKVNTGAICAVSREKAQTAIQYRRNLTGNDGRPEYFLP